MARSPQSNCRQQKKPVGSSVSHACCSLPQTHQSHQAKLASQNVPVPVPEQSSLGKQNTNHLRPWLASRPAMCCVFCWCPWGWEAFGGHMSCSVLTGAVKLSGSKQHSCLFFSGTYAHASQTVASSYSQAPFDGAVLLVRLHGTKACSFIFVV